MQYSYKTQELVDKGVDFSAIYPEKQTVVKEMTGFDFNLSNIVSFLKKETNNYQTQIPLALDLDKHIYGIYIKHLQKAGAKTTPTATATATTATEPTKQVLETRLKIVKAMLKKDPSKKVLETRIKIITKKLSSK